MSLVFVVDHERKPCAPVHPGRARPLLTRGRAAVYRRFPFTIMLKEGEPTEEPEPVRLKIDPGSKTTGLALLNAKRASISAGCVVAAAASVTPAIALRGFSIAVVALAGCPPRWRAASATRSPGWSAYAAGVRSAHSRWNW